MTDEIAKKLLSTTDAKVWTDEFFEVINNNGELEADYGLVLSWFANAIEVGRTAGQQWSGERSSELHTLQWRETELRDKVKTLKEKLKTERKSLTLTARALHAAEQRIEILENELGIRDSIPEGVAWGKDESR